MKRWLKRIAIFVVSLIGLLIAFIGVMAYLGSHGYFRQWGLKQQGKNTVRNFPELGRPAQSWTPSAARMPKNAVELFNLTNIWPARLSFTENDWKKIEPSSVEPVRNIMEHGRLVLTNPKASRSGLSGVIGIDFNWAPAEFEFAGAKFTNVAVRYRGNGTYINSLYGPKQSFKVDLNKYAKEQSLAGIDELNLLNSIPDFSYVRDTLAERLFRDLGVPGPRSSYTYLTIDAPGAFTNQALGLYVLMENIDGNFAKDRFGSKKTPIFKPVTYELFEFLGDDWAAYEKTYDLKTEAKPAELQKVIDFSRLVSKADDAEFEKQLPQFLNLDEFAAFVAGHVLLSSCDGFLANGQNYYVYLDPRTEKFGFISWDHDHSWGEFGYAATAEKREHLSIWEPYLYDFKFLKRVMKAEVFRAIYRQKLDHALQNVFIKERLYSQVDQLAAALRPAIAAENSFRLDRFEKSVSSEWLPGPRDGAPEGPHAPTHQIKRFIENRIESVRAQLDGKSEGVILRRNR